MTIFNFDIERGVYNFKFNDLNTESHSHPVVEIINATDGVFSLESNGQLFEDIEFAIIDSNTQHKLTSQKCSLKILMIESHNEILTEFLKKEGIFSVNGVFSKSKFPAKNKLFSEIKKLALTEDLKKVTDERINDTIKHIEENDIIYKNLIYTLTSKVFLSESRLSHLFKEQIGISIKKYLVWNKLKQAIKRFLVNDANLTNASLESGFFDQAHLTNSFKRVLGVSPSKAYNSRTLQS